MLLQQMAVLQAVPGAADERRSRAADDRAPGRRCWRPTRRSCSTASCCTVAKSWRLARRVQRPGRWCCCACWLSGRPATAARAAVPRRGRGAGAARRRLRRLAPLAGEPPLTVPAATAAHRYAGARVPGRRPAAERSAARPTRHAGRAVTAMPGAAPPPGARERPRPTAGADRARRCRRRLARSGRDWCAAEAIAALVRELALQSQLARATTTRWPLRVERESLRPPALRDKLQAALAEALGHAVGSSVEAGAADDSPAVRSRRARAARREAEQAIHDDPAGAGPDGAVQDGAHRAGVDQARLIDATQGDQQDP